MPPKKTRLNCQRKQKGDHPRARRLKRPRPKSILSRPQCQRLKALRRRKSVDREGLQKFDRVLNRSLESLGCLASDVSQPPSRLSRSLDQCGPTLPEISLFSRHTQMLKMHTLKSLRTMVFRLLGKLQISRILRIQANLPTMLSPSPQSGTQVAKSKDSLGLMVAQGRMHLHPRLCRICQRQLLSRCLLAETHHQSR